jgi:hypothetical protein
MADPVPILLNCINPNIEIGDPFASFKGIIKGFLLSIPELIKPDFVIKILTEGFGAFIDLLLKNLALPVDFPALSFTLKDPFIGIEISISLPGKDLGLDIFDPTPLIKFLIGLLKIAIGIPGIFLDIDTSVTPPLVVPKVPQLPGILLELITANIDVNFPDISKLEGFEDIAVRFPKCVLEAITGVLA